MNPKVLIVIIFLSFFFACDKDFNDEIWMSFNETQCHNPWQNISPTDTEYAVQKYLENNGINILNIKIETYSSGPFCEACNCPSGRKILVQILAFDIIAIKTLGFY